MSTNNGGPAFPEYASDHRGAACYTTFSPKGGITIRDYFAAKAMQAILSNDGAVSRTSEAASRELVSPDCLVATSAYAIADAMLREREK